MMFQNDRKSPDRLQEITLSIIDNRECQKKYWLITKITDDVICTFTKYGEGMCYVSIIHQL